MDERYTVNQTKICKKIKIQNWNELFKYVRKVGLIKRNYFLHFHHNQIFTAFLLHNKFLNITK